MAEYFRSQLLQLMKTMNATHPHYLRCLKPNDVKKPLVFEATKSMGQLRSSGLFEVIRIRKELFPYSMKHGEFVSKFKYVLGSDCQKPAFKQKDTSSQVDEILDHLKSIENWNKNDVQVTCLDCIDFFVCRKITLIVCVHVERKETIFYFGMILHEKSFKMKEKKRY